MRSRRTLRGDLVGSAAEEGWVTGRFFSVCCRFRNAGVVSGRFLRAFFILLTVRHCAVSIKLSYYHLYAVMSRHVCQAITSALVKLSLIILPC